MKILKRFVGVFKYNKLRLCKNHYTKKGKIKKFDDEFYAQFDNMFYIGIPIYYYLEKMSMGRCFDASAVLALALGGEAKVCRGVLRNAALLDDKKFVHGWVEVGDTVYDTTWKIIADKKTYYKTFGAKASSKTPQKEFFEGCKDLSDWTIHDKAYYETEEGNIYTLTIFTIQALQYEIIKNSHSSKEEISFAEKVLADLPDISKAKYTFPPLTREDLSKISGKDFYDNEDENEI